MTRNENTRSGLSRRLRVGVIGAGIDPGLDTHWKLR